MISRRPDHVQTQRCGFPTKREAQLFLAGVELGHASAAVTLDIYADLFDEDLDAVATMLDQMARSSSVRIFPPKTDLTPRPHAPETAQLPRKDGGVGRSDPSGIRTRVTAVRGRRTRPLYDGAVTTTS